VTSSMAALLSAASQQLHMGSKTPGNRDRSRSRICSIIFGSYPILESRPLDAKLLASHGLGLPASDTTPLVDLSGSFQIVGAPRVHHDFTLLFSDYQFSAVPGLIRRRGF